MDNFEELKKYVESRAEQIIGWDELEKKIRNGEKIKIKYGADPTKPDLHIGHAVAIKMMKKFQDLIDAEVQFLIGDFTTRIGDPTGKSKVRNILSEEKIIENAKSYATQAFKILDQDKTEVWVNGNKFNFIDDCKGGWWNEMSLSEFLSLISMVTYAKLIDRDMFQERIKNGKEIYMHEMMYPILQGYDSVKMKSDLTIVGTDQLFNELMGRFYQEKFDQIPQAIITMPILVGTDGKEKMSKSLDNYIGLEDGAGEMYGKTMSIPDDVIVNWALYASELNSAELEKDLQEGENPRNVKAKVAYDIVRQYWGDDEAKKAEEEFVNVFKNKENPENMLEISVNFDNLYKLIDLMVDNNLVSSKSEARRMIEQGAVKIDDAKIDDVNFELTLKADQVLKVGKRKFAKFVIKK